MFSSPRSSVICLITGLLTAGCAAHFVGSSAADTKRAAKKGKRDEDENKQEWETKPLKEMPKKIRRVLPDSLGKPIKLEKGKPRKDIEGFRVSWRVGDRVVWIFYSEKGRVIARSPKSVPAHVEPMSPIPGEVSFNKHVQPLLVKRCAKCHGVKKQKADLNFEKSYDTVMESVDAGDADGSPIMMALLGEESDVMPPKKPLPKREIEIIRQWISQGAKNN
jgi:hypothetical protein